MRAVFSVLVLLLLCSLWPRGVAAQATPPPLPPTAAPPPPVPGTAPQPAPAAAPMAPMAAPAAAPMAPMMASEPKPFARTNRIAITCLGFGIGSVSMESVHNLSDTFISVDPPQSGFQINGAIGFRYYIPYYVMAEVGYGAIYNWASSDIGGVTVENWNLVMEIPILVGGYYPFVKRLYAYGAVGPSVFFYPRSWWDTSIGGIPDFKADPGVGFHFVSGMDFLVAEHFALGLELRYRYLKTGELKEIKLEVPISQIVAEDQFGNRFNLPETDLDFSGVSVALLLRVFAM